MKVIEDIFQVSKNKDIDLEVEKLFKYWRRNGFPNYDRNNYNSKKELDKLINFNDDLIFNDKNLKQTMHGCGFL